MKILSVYPVTNTYGIAIIECNEDYVKYIHKHEGSDEEIHKAKIYYDTKRPYFISSQRWRIHLDECMMV